MARAVMAMLLRIWEIVVVRFQPEIGGGAISTGTRMVSPDWPGGSAGGGEGPALRLTSLYHGNSLFKTVRLAQSWLMPSAYCFVFCFAL